MPVQVDHCLVGKLPRGGATAERMRGSYANRSSTASWSSQKFHQSVTLPSALRWKTWTTFCSIRSPARSAVPASSATPCSSSASRSWTSNLNAAPISGSRSK